jgi:hypothetical protein
LPEAPSAVSAIGVEVAPWTSIVPATNTSLRLVSEPASIVSVPLASSEAPGSSVSFTPGATVRSPVSFCGVLQVVSAKRVPRSPVVGSPA